MRTWRIACSAAVLALGMATAAHADEWNKLTYLTFSGPVSMPGITLPAGTYRFELMDPDSSRRVIRVSEKDGSKQYGIFLSISDQKLEPSDDPVVMFRETPSGQPRAVRAWFYPGETYGYEFVYPHDQAMKIARATHQPVLSMKANASSTTEDRIAAMRGAEVGRIDENGQPVSTDAELKESSSQRPASTTASNQSTSTTTAGSTTAAPAPQPTPAAAQTNTASGQNAAVSASAAAQPTTAPKSTTGSRASTASPSTAAPSTTASDAAARQSTTASSQSGNRAVGTSGTAARRSLPRTASPLPMVTLLAFLSLGGAVGVRVARKSIA